MIVYGRNPVREALRGPREVRRIWATSSAARESWLAGAQDGTLKLSVESAARLQELCGSASHQGLCADVSEFQYVSGADLLSAPEPLIVALDQVQDPQNLGSVCRTAECAGATGLVVLERRSAAVTASVCKASAGAVEHLPVARVRNLVDFLDEAKTSSLWCYGAEANAVSTYEEVDFRGGVVLVLGSEGRGLRPRVAAACDLLLRIPLHGRVESLSVASAAAVLLYEAGRQRYRADS